MTTRHDQPDHDDRELDAFLRGEDDLSAQLRGLDQPTPPPQLDARIRAQAQEALREPAGAANDAEERALVTSPLGRWRGPLALAATVVIGVSVGLQWDGWRAKEPQALSDAVGPAAPGAVPAVVPDTAPAPSVDAVMPPPPPEPERAPRESAQPAPAAPVARPHVPAPSRLEPDVAARPAPALAENRVAPPAPPAAPAPATVDLRSSNHFANRKAAPSYLAESAPADTMAYARSPGAGTRVEVTGSRIAPPAPAAPRVVLDAAGERRARLGLQLIGELLDLHLDEEARTTWGRFRAEFPGYPVPQELRKRIEALPPTP